MDVILPNMPDISGEIIDQDAQLKDLLIAIKKTLEILTGTDPKSNDKLIDLLNENQ
jgi:hypothetical protein